MTIHLPRESLTRGLDYRWYTWKFEQTLQEKCGYKGTVPYWDWSSGMPRPAQAFVHRAHPFHLADAADVMGSDIWDDDPVSGLGRWGLDPSNDHTISTGAFKDIVLTYPSKHNIRRNFTLLPYKDFPVDGLHPDPYVSDHMRLSHALLITLYFRPAFARQTLPLRKKRLTGS